MLRGMYTAAAGMIMQQRKHDAITNNNANIDTPGFKRIESMSRSFPEILLSRIQNEQNETRVVPMGRLHTGVFLEENLPVFLQGDLQETGNPLDFALVSDIGIDGVVFDDSGKFISPDGEVIFRPQAFFTVLDHNGEERYTRNGKFTVNALGELVTYEGYRVMGDEGQPVVLRDPETDMLIDRAVLDSSGLFVTESGQPIARLQIMRIDQPYLLHSDGQGLYRADPDNLSLAAPINADDQVQVRQGFIERSNVDPIRSMVDMNLALRSYEANQVVIQYYDRSLDKAVNEVGRV